MKEPSKIGAEALLVLTTAIWGSTFLIIKLMVREGAANSPFALLGARFAIATIVAIFAFWPGRCPGKSEIVGGLIIGIAAFGGYAFQTLGLVHTTPARSGFITSLFVLLIPFLSRFWEKAKIPLKVYLALIPAAFGLWAISGAGISFADINPGDKITFLSAICYAFQIVGIQIYTRRGDWKWLTIIQFGVVAFGSGIGAIFESGTHISTDLPNLIGIAYLAIFATVGALGVQMFAQRFSTSARASLIYIAEPIFAALLAMVVIGDTMGGMEIVGAVAIILSMFVGRFPTNAGRPRP